MFSTLRDKHWGWEISINTSFIPEYRTRPIQHQKSVLTPVQTAVMCSDRMLRGIRRCRYCHSSLQHVIFPVTSYWICARHRCWLCMKGCSVASFKALSERRLCASEKVAWLSLELLWNRTKYFLKDWFFLLKLFICKPDTAWHCSEKMPRKEHRHFFGIKKVTPSSVLLRLTSFIGKKNGWMKIKIKREIQIGKQSFGNRKIENFRENPEFPIKTLLENWDFQWNTICESLWIHHEQTKKQPEFQQWTVLTQLLFSNRL